MRFSCLVCTGLGLIVSLAAGVSADVYVNMLWDEQQGGFKVQPLVVDGGITFDRDYQNAYGEAADLEPGPPFIIQASIQGAGQVSFVSGGLDLTNPFTIYVQPSGDNSGRFSLADGINFEGSPLDPIRLEGQWKIQVGTDYQTDGGTMTWAHTRFLCQYDPDNPNPIPITISGLGLDADWCFFPDYGAPFEQLILVIDHNDFNPTYSVSFADCEFKRLNFSNGMWRAISIGNYRRASFERCAFEDVSVSEYAFGGLVTMSDCGILSIKNNTAKNNNLSKFHVINAWAADSAYIRTNNDLPLVANDMEVYQDSALAIGKGSVLKFLYSGGIESAGRLYIDSAVLTSYQDDSYGGDTDLEPEPVPIIQRWKTDGGRGITILPGGRATIHNSKILNASGAINAEGSVDIDNCDIADCDDFGVYLNSPYADTFRIAHTTISRITDKQFAWASGIGYRHAALWSQQLTIDSVTIVGNDVDGIYVPYIADQFTSISIDRSVIANNFGYGIYVVSDPHLRNFTVTNSIIAGNYYAGIRMAEQFYQGGDVHIEGNLVVGNGHGPLAGTPNYGLSLTKSPPYVVGNTVAYNAGVGLVYWDVESIEQTVVVNNLFLRNGDYGLMKSDAGAHLLANNAFWENGDDEIRYQGPSGRIYTVEELQALGGEFATNMHIAPMLAREWYGTIDSLAYNDTTWVSKLIDRDGSFSGANLAGSYVCPDTLTPSWHYILSSLGDTLFLAGNASDYAAPGGVYRIFDPHVQQLSPLVDAGRNASVTLARDLDGDQRILDGDDDDSTVVDVGVDEYKPDGAEPPIRVLEPSRGGLLVAYSGFTIKFTADDSIAWVDIEYNYDYDSTLPNDNWTSIATRLDASKGKHYWEVPSHTTSSNCRVRVVSSTNSSIYGLSDRFSMKHLCLTRTNDSGRLVEYLHPDDSWSIPNDSANMWPPASWINYFTATDTITGLTYPAEFYDLGASIWDFPSWPVFVEAFGFNACYFDYWTGPVYKPSALLRWAAIEHQWNGSCLGLAITSLLAFSDSASFAVRPEIGPFANLHGITIDEARRSLINRYYTYQFGQRSIDHTRAARRRTPRQTLADLTDMLSRRDASLLDRVLTLCDTSSVNNRGCHTVTPYYLDRVSAVDSTWGIGVYDNNRPNDYLVVEVDGRANTWTYAPLGLGGDRLLFLEDSLANYDTVAILIHQRDHTPIAASDGSYIQLYLAAADRLVFGSGLGTAGYDGDSLFCTIADATPIVARAAAGGRPLGYQLPADKYAVEANGPSAAQRLTAFFDSTIACVRRSTGDPAIPVVLTLDPDGAVHLYNVDTTDQSYDVDFVITAADHERLAAIRSIAVTSSDSLITRIDSLGHLGIDNRGGDTRYELQLTRVSATDLAKFKSGTLDLNAGESHRFEPDWDSVGSDYVLLLVDSDGDGVFEDTVQVENDIVTAVDGDTGGTLPPAFALSQNYPNPFNPTTTIEYSLARRGDVLIEVYNLLGRKVRTLVDVPRAAGVYTAVWDSRDDYGNPVATGIYLYRFQADGQVQTRKMLLLK